MQKKVLIFYANNVHGYGILMFTTVYMTNIKAMAILIGNNAN